MTALQGVLDRIDQHSDTIAGHADWSEANSQLHKETFACLIDIGVPRLFLPASLGGLEIEPASCARICERLADLDSAAAWHVMVFNAARLMAATWPVELVERIWKNNPDVLVAASGHSPLQGEQTDPHHVTIHGTQRFVSGCQHGEWLMTPVILAGQPHMALLPMRACQIQDNWDTLGMRGSGSNDVLVDGVTVPAEQIVSAAAATANSHYNGQLYRCPSRVVFATYVPVALSLAGRALELVKTLASAKTQGGTANKLRDRMLGQVHYGKALAEHRASKQFFYAELEKAWARAAAGNEFTPEDRADLYLAGTHAVQASASVVRKVADIAATTVVAKAHPLDRISRDMETLRHHGFVSESRYASVTQIHWNAELDYPQLLR